MYIYNNTNSKKIIPWAKTFLVSCTHAISGVMRYLASELPDNVCEYMLSTYTAFYTYIR